MHDAGLRINGGIGFAIELPSIIVKATPSERITIFDSRNIGLSGDAERRLKTALENAHNHYSLNHYVSIEISGEAIASHGFGSGTAVRLSCLEALMILNGVELSNTELVRFSWRGGTSGIGINTYFSGGAVLDLGVKNKNSEHQPSSVFADGIEPPLVLQQHDMPGWDIGICIPSRITQLTKEQEVDFFKKTCPISESGAYKALYHSISGVFASICEQDKESFEHSIRALQECEWKKAEREIHGSALSELEGVLYKAGASAVGMSSLGPSLFFLAENVDSVIKLAEKKLSDSAFLKTKPCNRGRKIECLN